MTDKVRFRVDQTRPMSVKARVSADPAALPSSCLLSVRVRGRVRLRFKVSAEPVTWPLGWLVDIHEAVQ